MRAQSQLANVVEAHQLTKRYPGGVVAVQGLDLTIRKGEVFGFLGPNGAGKTTTLRMLAGLIRPTSGHAVVAGGAPGSANSLSRLGAMIESPAFWPYLSGRDNLRLLARYCRVPDARLDPVLSEVEMTDRAGRAYSTYSSGMKQRLGVAAALLKSPELLILDEPTSGLDPQGMAEFRDLIKRLGQGERTVLLSSHLLGEVEQTCTRVGVISKGRLVAEGTVDEIRGGAQLFIRASPSERAMSLLQELVGGENVQSVGEGGFNIRVDPARSGEINQQLVTGGVVVTELRPGERSLEDVFMELTGREAGH
ncbi:MAG TPA: ABC transporter ATP-binding protein [Candidatus Acidoferrum sp.]|nr:ABC transporter ATP-binding protein [Candidatus Acidoferrum sp.]